MQTDLYHQCFLGCGRCRQVAWIPEKFAHVGRVVKLRYTLRYMHQISNRVAWSDGWQVLAVSPETCTAADIDRWRSTRVRYGHETDLKRGELSTP